MSAISTFEENALCLQFGYKYRDCFDATHHWPKPLDNSGAKHMNEKTSFPLAVIRATETQQLPADDAIRIHELLHRVYLAEDTRDADALRQLVTPDFTQVHTIFGGIEGREHFVAWVMGHPESFDGLRHQAMNIAARALGADRAEAISYILVFQVFDRDPHVQEQLPRLIGHGAVTDTLIKPEGGWQLQKRVYDQFSLSAAYVPNTDILTSASRSLHKAP